ncbi:MAG: ATP-binding protein [Pseudomonadota bacterium]
MNGPAMVNLAPAGGDGLAEQCIRDLMGLVALPALWVGREGPDILQIMLEAIDRIVQLDFCFVQVALLPGQPEYELARVPRGGVRPPLSDWRAAVEHWAQHRVADGRGFDAATPLGDMRVLRLSMGFGTYGGKIWFGARDPGFPSYTQLALLRVATTLAVTGLQGARLNDEREKASRAKDEFLAMLAHELRNPLAPISAAAEVLALTQPDNPKVAKISGVITRQARHMTGLIDDLLDVSRVTRGLVELECQPVDLKQVATEAVEQARPLLEARGHRFTLDLPARAAFVQGDHKRLVQVIGNLLNNAAKYTPPGGNVVLRIEVSQQHVSIAVEDNGVGMSAELIAKAFELFTQASRSVDRSQGGLGLGLALVRSLVELHQGSVSARSPGEGLGTTLTVKLPRLAGEETGAPSAAAAQPDYAPGGLRLLVVDDNADAAQMLAVFMETLGHRVTVEGDARNVLDLAAAFAPDVCLLDIGLPHIDGYELARRLRADPRTRHAILIAATGYGQDEDRARTAAAGFDHHFVKPLDLAALAQLLATVQPRRAGAP